jgi:UPF0716 protein FxsA
VVVIEVGRSIGVWPTLGLLVLISAIGALVVRVQGLAAWRSLNRSVRAGEPPSPGLADAAVRVVAGVLLVVPGFVTDVVAVLLLIPVTRAVVRRPLQRSLRRAAEQRVTLRGPFPPGARPTFRRGDVVEGEIIGDGEEPEPGAPRV